MIDLINELNDLSSRLNTSIDVLKRYGRQRAEAERDYKLTLREEALKLKEQGMAVTLIDKVIYGVPNVADKRLKRDIEETMYKAAMEQINTLKLQIRIVDAQINREWTSNG